MVACVGTVAFEGVEVRPVDVQVQVANGMPAFTIVGLPDKAVAESKERVRSALHALGLSLPPKRITINLAPADVSKEGSHYDLPIALGVLAAMGMIPEDEIVSCVALGELSLDGSIRQVAGVLPAAIYASAAELSLICPEICGQEAAWAGDLEIFAPKNLLQMINHFKGQQVMSPVALDVSVLKNAANEVSYPDFSSVKGQETAKRSLEIAASGGHNLLMAGPPGSGKSMLSACLPGILPPLDPSEALEISMIHSISGSLPDGGLMKQRPYRSPHHSASQPALIGGGHKAKPGEISLAHHGVLFLDELPEFQRSTLESLRQPLESGEAHISRANHHVTYPAKFQLIAAMNPCRCGYLGDTAQECNRAPKCGKDYQAKLSGPLLDRFDIQVEVPAVPIFELQNIEAGEGSDVIAQRVVSARERQMARQGKLNSRLGANEVETFVILDEKARAFVLRAAEKMRLSARSYHRLLKVARTIADMEEGNIEVLDQRFIAEAIGFRGFSAG